MFSEFNRLARNFDTLADELMPRGGAGVLAPLSLRTRVPLLAGPAAGELVEFQRAPLVNFEETSPNEYTLTCEMPGLDRSDVKVEIDSETNTLNISGSKSEKTERKEGTYRINESRSSSFYRSLRLPDDIDQSKDIAPASFKNGLVSLSLPRSPALAVTTNKNIKSIAVE
jgi:HSP20 family molecular chaperone IbpA